MDSQLKNNNVKSNDSASGNGPPNHSLLFCPFIFWKALLIESVRYFRSCSTVNMLEFGVIKNLCFLFSRQPLPARNLRMACGRGHQDLGHGDRALGTSKGMAAKPRARYQHHCGNPLPAKGCKWLTAQSFWNHSSRGTSF